jgi:sugar/nucleoside kinase (ribokinase family)
MFLFPCKYIIFVKKKKFKIMSLLVVGSVAFDSISTPFGNSDKIVGGAATYISLSASNFTQNIKLVGVVGGDFPKDYIKLLENRGVDTTGLQIKESEKTFFWAGKYHNDMNHRDTLVTELNVLGDFDPILPESYQACEYLMLGNLAPKVQSTVINRLAKRPKLIMMDTMNFWMEIAMQDLKETVAMVDVLCINDEEARLFTKEYSLVKAAKQILALGVKTLIIKKGEHGALLFNKDEVFFAPALPIEDVFDPTGAGDTFAGGFIGYIAQTGDTSFANMKRAIIHGSAMASYCVEKFGTQRLLELTDVEIENRIAQFVDLVKFDVLAAKI